MSQQQKNNSRYSTKKYEKHSSVSTKKLPDFSNENTTDNKTVDKKTLDILMARIAALEDKNKELEGGNARKFSVNNTLDKRTSRERGVNKKYNNINHQESSSEKSSSECESNSEVSYYNNLLTL
jgi:hypothetical protein